ncbi:MAG: oligosaccharide flippase family protein [Alphaproteobacteria bacterium]|nr:oligosaccharide flippase family protein [Alphaproteobacteria bacterium]
MNPVNGSSARIGIRTAAGAGVLVASRLITRGVDFAALIILARLLSVEDFGVIAVATSVVMIFEAVTDLSLGLALVAIADRTSAHYDTIFTIQLVRGLLLAAALVILSWPVAFLYHDPRLMALICALSLAPAFRGMGSPRMTEFSIEFRFLPFLIVDAVGKGTAFAASIAAAVWTPNYWALVVNSVAAPLTSCVASYLFAPWRGTRLTFEKWRDFAHYLGWSTIGQTVSALDRKMDILILGGVADHLAIGAYAMAADVVALPAQIFVFQILQPFVVAFSAVRQDGRRLAAAYQRAAAGVVAVCLPILVGASLCAESLLRLAFGEKWIASATSLRWLAIAAIPYFFTGPLQALAISLQKVNSVTRLILLELAVKFPLVLVGLANFGVAGVLGARVITALLVAGVAMITVRRLIGLRIRDQIFPAQRAIVSVAGMALVVGALQVLLRDHGGASGEALHLAIVVGAGILAYVGAMLALWNWAGRPASVEGDVFAVAGGLLRRAFGFFQR